MTQSIYDIWNFQRLLRKLEYYMNCKHSLYWDLYTLYLGWRLKREGFKLGFLIPPNVFGPGLSIAHPGTIIVNPSVRVGENCRIHNCVHLATQAGFENACPKLGDNIFIGPGAVIIGDIEIADGIAIGANSVVNKSFLEKGITIAGAPAKKISNSGSGRCYQRSTDMVRAKAEIIADRSRLSADTENICLRLAVRNLSRDIWTKDSFLRIGTWDERDRSSAYYHNSWISPNRICTFSEDEIPPGDIATFNFQVTPNKSVPHETFRLVMENRFWIPNTEFLIKMREQ